MTEKVLKAFREKKRFNIFELVLKLQADKNHVKETLDILVDLGKLRVEGKRFLHTDKVPVYKFLCSRCSIRGFPGETYILNVKKIS